MPRDSIVRLKGGKRGGKKKRILKSIFTQQWAVPIPQLHHIPVGMAGSPEVLEAPEQGSGLNLPLSEGGRMEEWQKCI